MSALTNITGPAGIMDERTRVMIVDDSAVIRGLIGRTLEAQPDLVVVTSVPDGELAVTALKRTIVDVIVLDIEMPRMDGLTAIPLLLGVAPAVKIVMASTLTSKNAEISLRALSAGATDYIAKPTTARDMIGPLDFNRELVEKVRHLGAAARQAGSRSRTPAPRAGTGPAVTRPVPPAPVSSRPAPVLRARAVQRPKIIALGSSTGGPQALFQVLKHLTGLRQPILLTQHMPPTFTTILAEHISRQCGVPAVEAQTGMAVEAGRLYVAPGNFHMTVTGDAAAPVLNLDQEEAENFCRPAVDPMLRSIVGLYGAAVLAVILTGMGQDGMRGCRVVTEAGGSVMAQDEATSVVWGMPGAVATAGLCSEILPIDRIGPRMREIAQLLER